MCQAVRRTTVNCFVEVPEAGQEAGGGKAGRVLETRPTSIRYVRHECLGKPQATRTPEERGLYLVGREGGFYHH